MWRELLNIWKANSLLDQAQDKESAAAAASLLEKACSLGHTSACKEHAELKNSGR